MGMQYVKSIFGYTIYISKHINKIIPKFVPNDVSSASLIRALKLKNKSTHTRPGIVRVMSESSKPPNVFIYTGEEPENSDLFQCLRATFQTCLNPDKYVVYHLPSPKLCSIPWQDNTVLLIVSCKTVPDSVKHLIHDYASCGGRVLSLCSNLVCPGVRITKANVSLPCTVNLSYSNWPLVKINRKCLQISISEGTECQVLARDSDNLEPLIVKCPVGQGVMVFSQVGLISDNPEGDFSQRCLRDLLSCHLGLDCSSQPEGRETTAAHLFIRTGSQNSFRELLSHANDNLLRLHHVTLDVGKSPLAGDKTVSPGSPYPVILSSDDSSVDGFNWLLFQDHLETRRLGSVVFYADTVTSTMDFVEGLPVDVGAVSIANIQTKGKGRAGNAWLSPRGCAMFSVQLWLSRDSHLGQALPFVQQLATLAVLLSVKDSSGPYQHLDVGLKWPNDLYYAKKIKFGGVLAKSTMIGNIFQCCLGFGVNLSNGLPTVCLNDMIRTHNEVHGTQMEPLRMEVLVARTLNHLERLMDTCQQRGTDSSLPELYRHWIHQDQKLVLEAINEEVTVQGLDSCGFLCVQRLQGQTLTLHPDGNSLDQMKNLLIAK